MKTGFYFFTPRVDFFFVCDNLTKTPGRMRQIDEILTKQFLCTYRGMSGLWPLKQLVQPATIEKKSSKFGEYYDIKGIRARFSAGTFRNQKRTEIINL